jgi:hypothetical protein
MFALTLGTCVLHASRFKVSAVSVLLSSRRINPKTRVRIELQLQGVETVAKVGIEWVVGKVREWRSVTDVGSFADMARAWENVRRGVMPLWIC